MDGESVSQSPSEDIKSFSVKRVFREQWPYYIHLGMSYDEYWRMDCELVRDYRKAYEYKQEYDNSMLWLQGLYVYKAMEAQRPGWAFYGKKAPKPSAYEEKPIPITKQLRQKYAAERTQMMARQFREKLHRKNQNLNKSSEEGGKHGEHQG